jgi:hypothetical protein
MPTERRDVELWRERDWHCEAWIVGGQPQVRLYLRDQLVSDLTAGPRLDLHQQTEAWLRAVHADKHRT